MGLQQSNATLGLNIVRRFMEGPDGDLNIVENSQEIFCTAAKAATLPNTPGTVINIFTQYPTGLALSAVTGTGFSGSFTGTAEATDGYELQVATNDTFSTMASGYPATLPAGTGTRSFSVTGLTTGLDYFVRVRSKSTLNQDSIFSLVKTAHTANVRSALVLATSPFVSYKHNEASGLVAINVGSGGSARNGAITSPSGTPVLYAQTAVDTSEAANKSMNYNLTNHAILEGFALQSGAVTGIGISLDYKGTGSASGRLISLHNSATSNMQVFIARPASGIKARIRIVNMSSDTLVDTTTTADFFNNVRNNIVLRIVGNAYAVVINGVLDITGTFASQATSALDCNRIVINGFGNTGVPTTHNTGNYGDVSVWFGSVPSNASFISFYSLGVWA